MSRSGSGCTVLRCARAGGRGCEPRAASQGPWLVFLARGLAVDACLVGARAVRTCMRAGGAENNVCISQPCVFMQV